MNLLKKLYIRFSGYSYTNLGRLFLRLFVGVMLLQFGVRQIAHFGLLSEAFPHIIGMSGETALVLLICVEIGCSLFIMAGFLTRFMTIPPIIAMIIAECYQFSNYSIGEEIYQLGWQSPIYLPIMFLGIYLFIMLVGPGKISVDYFYSLYLIHSEDKSEDELEEV